MIRQYNNMFKHQQGTQQLIFSKLARYRRNCEAGLGVIFLARKAQTSIDIH